MKRIFLLFSVLLTINSSLSYAGLIISGDRYPADNGIVISNGEVITGSEAEKVKSDIYISICENPFMKMYVPFCYDS
ncbi:MAG: hypothetical protein LBE52_04745 [Providencia sp.]|nr:hypothetical protein [Providencia sp.]